MFLEISELLLVFGTTASAPMKKLNGRNFATVLADLIGSYLIECFQLNVCIIQRVLMLPVL